MKNQPQSSNASAVVPIGPKKSRELPVVLELRRRLAADARSSLERAILLGPWKTIRNFCKETGVPRQTLLRVLYDKSHNPHLATIYRIANAFQLDSTKVYQGDYEDFLRRRSASGFTSAADFVLRFLEGTWAPGPLPPKVLNAEAEALTTLPKSDLLKVAAMTLEFANAYSKAGMSGQASDYQFFTGTLCEAAKQPEISLVHLKNALRTVRPVDLRERACFVTKRILKLLSKNPHFPRHTLANILYEFGIRHDNCGLHKEAELLFEESKKHLLICLADNQGTPLERDLNVDLSFVDRRLAQILGHKDCVAGHNRLLEIADEFGDLVQQDGRTSTLAAASWVAIEHGKYTTALELHEQYASEFTRGTRWPEMYHHAAIVFAANKGKATKLTHEQDLHRATFRNLVINCDLALPKDMGRGDLNLFRPDLCPPNAHPGHDNNASIESHFIRSIQIDSETYSATRALLNSRLNFLGKV